MLGLPQFVRRGHTREIVALGAAVRAVALVLRVEFLDTLMGLI